MNNIIPKDNKQIKKFCELNHIAKFAFFGSVVRDDFRPESDVDVLVEFEPGHVPGLAFFKMEHELSKILGRKVDLNTPGFLSPLIRSKVMNEAVVQYDAA
ncbi:MAG: nucleotidyltransferase [Elusimicrobia bacterium RIFCSPLOWO2_01_FULL_54_10]|nr:MAG: nucleotidyltransferase [Elusimicrobia bacterium RIFCSPLOWO2_01_FULL_54_10]